MMACEGIQEQIRDLQRRLESRELALQRATSAERPALVSQIRDIVAQLRNRQEDLQRCLAAVPPRALPSVVNYEPYLTLLRCQNGSGGCGGMSTMHAFDIQMERVAPYSPDASYAFNAYVYNDSMGLGHAAHDPRITRHGLNQAQVLTVYGSCPETSFPTTYDPPRDFWPNEPAPADHNFAEATHYRAAKIGGEPGAGVVPASVEELKKLLFEKGPLICLGGFDGHVVTLIGYNDSTSTIKYVNSWPLSSGGGGVQDRADAGYDYFMDRFRNKNATVKWIEVDPAKIVRNRPPIYTGRIRINHLFGRRYLTVSVGVEGQQPLIIWDRNCSTHMLDDYLDLSIDFPLPAYARQFWPPSKGNWWYAEVIDHTPGNGPGPAAFVEDVVLVQRLFSVNGACRPVLYRPSCRRLDVEIGGTVRVFIPSRKICSCILSLDQNNVAPETPIDLRGYLIVQIGLSSTQNIPVPLANKRIFINRVDYEDPIEGSIEYPVGQVESDAQGKFSLSTTVSRTTRYRAIATEPDGTVLATSTYVEVSVSRT